MSPFPEILKNFASHDPNTRLSTVRVLADYPPEDAVRVLEILESQLARERSPEVRQAIKETVQQLLNREHSDPQSREPAKIIVTHTCGRKIRIDYHLRHRSFCPHCKQRITAEVDVEPAAQLSDVPEALRSRYAVVRRLGEGAFGTVFLAKDHVLRRDVAIKILDERHSSSAEIVERFEIDARIVASLGHPHIVAVYDLVERRFIVMEYMSGGSVRDLIARLGPVPVATAIHIVAAVLRALAAAHARTIVHRDVKPENILLSDTGIAKLCDFGVAHVPEASTRTMHDGSGILHPGTLAYMSPEQVRGERLDGRSDIYSAGVVLHEMLSAKHYIDAQYRRTQVAIAMAIQNQEPAAVGRLFGHIPRKIDQLIARMMAKDPSRRFPSAAEAADALQSV